VYPANNQKQEWYMSIVKLSSPSMILILEYMLSGESLKLLKSNDLLTPMIVRLQKVLDNLRASRELLSTPLTPEKEKAIRKILRTLDLIHDNRYRSLSLLLELAENAVTGEEYKLQITSLIEDLFPFGLSIIGMKWVDEAGEAQRLGKQLEDQNVQSLLSGIKFTTKEGEHTALELAKEIVTTGQKMSKQLVALVSLDETGGFTLETQARRQFTKMYRHVNNLAQLEWEEQPKNIKIITKAFREQMAQLPVTKDEEEEPTPNPSSIF
tara:strand:+ start:6326 stop:7126 length:801 start_codon:yes stop_codon:yes gene_type:complete